MVISREEVEAVTVILPIVLVLPDTILPQSMVPPVEKTNGSSEFDLNIVGNTTNTLYRQYDTRGSQRRNERYDSGRRNYEDSSPGTILIPNMMTPAGGCKAMCLIILIFLGAPHSDTSRGGGYYENENGGGGGYRNQPY